MKRILVCVLMLCCPLVAVGDVAFISTVSRTLLTSDAEFGGCLVKPNASISSRLNCPDTWVTLDCAGTLGGSKAAGQRRFDAVTLAVLTGQKVTFRINDERKINGWCAADRVASVPN